MNAGAVSENVGDIHSEAKGSGARFNAGKPAIELIPLRFIAASWNDEGSILTQAMYFLGNYQEDGDDTHLWAAIETLGTPWEDCANVFTYGKAKYAAWNWAKGMAWSIPLACAARHLMKMQKGELLDDESGLPHVGHVMCNIVMLLTFSNSFQEGNDLPIDKLNTSPA